MPLITVKALRFDPGKMTEKHFQTYQLDVEGPLSVMSLMARIHDRDPDFACRTSQCFHGTCLSCLVRVNGKDVVGCETLVQPGEEIILEPHSKYRIIRDLVVDFEQRLQGEKGDKNEN